jgi:hypothetical protein
MDFPDLAVIFKMVLLGSQTLPEKEELKVLVVSNLKVTEPVEPVGWSPSFLQKVNVHAKAHNRPKIRVNRIQFYKKKWEIVREGNDE